MGNKKTNFGADLEDLIILTRTNSSHLFVVDNGNSRLDANIDPRYAMVGPHTKLSLNLKMQYF